MRKMIGLVVIVVTLLCQVVGAQTWLPIGPFWFARDAILDGNNRLVLSQDLNNGGDSNYYSQFDLVTGQQLWRRYETIQIDPSRTVGLAASNDHSFFSLTMWAGLTFAKWDSNGNNTIPPVSIDSTFRYVHWTNYSCDQLGNLYITWNQNRVGWWYWRINSRGEIDKRILLNPGTAYNFRVACDHLGGAYLWAIEDSSNNFFRHYLWHIDGTTDSVQGPIIYRTTSRNVNMSGLYYSWNARKLVAIEQYDSLIFHLERAIEIDPDSLRMTHICIPFDHPTQGNGWSYCADADTIWQLSPIGGYDSSGIYHDDFRLILSGLAADTNWFVAETLPRNMLVSRPDIPNRAIVALNNQLVVLWNGSGITRRISNTGVDKPYYSLPQSNFFIFPNPTNGWFTLSGFSNSKSRWQLFDILGREVLSGTIPRGTSRTAIQFPSQLSSGSYYLQLADPPQSQIRAIRLVR